MKKNIKIRVAEPQDSEGILILDNKVFPNNKAGLGKINKRIEDQLIFVAELDNNVLGFLFYKSAEKREKAWIMSKIAVDEKYRRMGIGSNLFEFAAKRAKKKGIEIFIYRVRVDNRKVIKMYRERGAKITEEIEGFYRDNQNAYQMEENI
jgi:ribosomal protein S18 acetylase RimI-like enzyme